MKIKKDISGEFISLGLKIRFNISLEHFRFLELINNREDEGTHYLISSEEVVIPTTVLSSNTSGDTKMLLLVQKAVTSSIKYISHIPEESDLRLEFLEGTRVLEGNSIDKLYLTLYCEVTQNKTKKDINELYIYNEFIKLIEEEIKSHSDMKI